MDFTQMVEALRTHTNVFTVVLFVLLVVSEILGGNPNIKASSIYGVIKVLLLTLRDQVFPTTPVPPAQS